MDNEQIQRLGKGLFTVFRFTDRVMLTVETSWEADREGRWRRTGQLSVG
jgi:hypothetical protein